MVLKFFITAVLLSYSFLSTSAHSSSLVFLHFNDFYEIIGRSGKGGLYDLNQLIEQQKKVHPNAIVTFGGDLLSPSFYSSISKGQHMIDAMALLGVDVAVPGNHEFDFGLHNAVTQFKASKFPWVISNLNAYDNSLSHSTETFYIHKINGLRVGFIGLLTPQLAILSKDQKTITVLKVIDTAAKMVAELQEQNVDMIVALTHLNLEEDKHLANEVNGIDLILGGHDHYPVSLMLNNTLILKSGLNGEYLGLVKAKVNKSGKQKTSLISWQLLSTARSALDLNKELNSENKEITQFLKQHQEQLTGEKNKRLAITMVELDARTNIVRSAESSFANLVADALRVQNKTDIALINGGAIRSDKIYSSGEVLTENDILSALPFANRVSVVKVSGRQIMTILEHGVAAVENFSGRFPQTSGLSFQYSPESKPGQRISQVMIADKPVEANRIYTLATVDFLLQGGDGYEQFLQAETIISAEQGDLLTNVLSAYLSNLKQIEAISKGRVQILQENNKDSH